MVIFQNLTPIAAGNDRSLRSTCGQSLMAEINSSFRRTCPVLLHLVASSFLLVSSND